MPPDSETGAEQHTIRRVYTTMLAQVCMDYPALPDPRTLRLFEIRFFYEQLRATLRERTRPTKDG